MGLSEKSSAKCGVLSNSQGLNPWKSRVSSNSHSQNGRCISLRTCLCLQCPHFTRRCIDITGEKMAKIISAAKVNVEAFWPGLFAKALQGRNIGDLICNVGSAPAAGGGGGAPAADAGGAAAPAEEKKEEKKDDSDSGSGSDDDMGFGLFD